MQKKAPTTNQVITDIRQLPFVSKSAWDITPTYEPKKDHKIGRDYGRAALDYLKSNNTPIILCNFLSAFPKKEKWSSIEYGFIQFFEKELIKSTVFSVKDDLILKKKLIQVQETQEIKETEKVYDIILNHRQKQESKKLINNVVFQAQGTEYPMTIHDANGVRWVPSKEVGAALGNTNIRKLIKGLSEQSELIENKHYCNLTLQKSGKGNPNITALSHRGIIRVAMRSEGKRAKDFRDWAEDVLFEVMVTGQYGEQPTKQRSSNLGKRLTNLEQAYNRMVESNNILAKYIRDLDGFMQETFSPKQIPEKTETFSFALDDFEHDKIMKIVWYHFVETAAKKTGYVTINRWGGRTVFLKKGQLIYGQPSTAKKIGVSKNALRNRVDILIKMGKIKREKVSNYSLISVVGMG